MADAAKALWMKRLRFMDPPIAIATKNLYHAA